MLWTRLENPFSLVCFVTSLQLVICVAAGNGEFSQTVQHVLKSVQNVVGNLQDYVGGVDGCIFTCPPGLVPGPKQNHRPHSNGCGSFGIQLENYVSFTAVTKCCNQHDFCYDTCLKSKGYCDTEFKKCLKNICQLGKKTISDEFYQGCKSAADLMYSGTLALGCKAYKDAQKEACLCKQRSDL